MSSGHGKRKAACLTPEPGATSATNRATSAARPTSENKPTSAATGQAKQRSIQSYLSAKPVLASAASTAAPSTTDPSPPPKPRSLFRCVVHASAGDKPQLKEILRISADAWISRYHSDCASASVELADMTVRLAERINRQQVGLAGNPPPPVPPTADGGQDDAGLLDNKIAPEMAAFERGLRTLMVTLLEKVCSQAGNRPRTRRPHTRLN